MTAAPRLERSSMNMPSTTPPLKILHTEAAKGFGGQEIYIYRHMLAMRERGHDVSLLCQPGARLGTIAREAGFTVHDLKMGACCVWCAGSGRCGGWCAAMASTWSIPPAAATA